MGAISEEQIAPPPARRLLDKWTQVGIVTDAIVLDKTDRPGVEADDETFWRIRSVDARRMPRAHLFETRPARPPSRDEIIVEPSLQQGEVVMRERTEADLRIVGHHRGLAIGCAAIRD